MSRYGDIIDSGYDPKKEQIYYAFSEYFKDPIMTKIKDVQSYSVYMTKVYAMLGTSYRYIVAFVELNKQSVGDKQLMSSLEWISLQTRTLTDNHNIPAHSYVASNRGELTQKIKLLTRDDEKSTYDAEVFPITVTLLTTRKNNSHQYSPTGNIIIALETYQTLINFK